jgi:heat shock protein HtpX
MSDATGFIAEQRRNRRASVLILSGTFALLFLVANLVTGILGGYTTETCTTARVLANGTVVVPQTCTSEFRFNAVALIVTIMLVGGYLFIAWFASASAALTMVQARPADGPEFAELRNLVEQMSIASGIPVPRTYVVDDTAPNAFATGRNPDHAAITVTTGLLAVMSRRELRGVLAHEMAHIRNRDIAVTTLAVLAVGAIAVIAQVALRIGMFGSMRRGGRDNNGFALFLLLSLAIYLLAVPAGLLLKASLSRKRESLADATAVELTREPAGLRSALEKLEADTTVITNPSAATAHLWIESPLERGRDDGFLGSFGRMMDTHPPLSERIAKLRAIEGLDPEGRGPNDPFPTAI